VIPETDDDEGNGTTIDGHEAVNPGNGFFLEQEDQI